MMHLPVLAAELIAYLSPFQGLCCDATYGRGGHTALLLERYSKSRVVGLDRDQQAIDFGWQQKKRYPSRLELIHTRFSDMVLVLEAQGIFHLDGVIFDLGMSSPQLDQAARGFSFMRRAPLDMRMDKETDRDAAWYINHLDERSLKKLFITGGVEKSAGRLARMIIQVRQEDPITETTQLAELIRKVLPFSKRRIDTATVAFQAIRIHVNDELNELKRGLIAAEKLLVPGGKLCVLSFHSLEDRIVKQFLNKRSRPEAAPSRHVPFVENARKPSFTLVTKKPLSASEEEIKRNPRSISAKLRAAERTDAPPFPANDQDREGKVA